VFTVLTKFGSNPTRGSPVVTSGTGRGASFTHHNRYSTRAHVRHSGPLSTIAAEGAGAAVVEVSAEFLESAGISAFEPFGAGNGWATSCPALRNPTPTSQSNPLRTASFLCLFCPSGTIHRTQTEAFSQPWSMVSRVARR